MKVVSVKFKENGRAYYFDPGEFKIKEGDFVVVTTARGTECGEVVRAAHEVPGFSREVKPVIRVADAVDVRRMRQNRADVQQAYHICEQRIAAHNLKMKLVDAEYTLDRSKLVFYFTADNRVDFRELVKDLVREYRARIELRQIGVRHETQMVGAVGNCGMVCCCRRYLRKFAPVTIRMAKEQHLFLTPAKLSGICGRLLCCLSYEQENYDRFHHNCPRLGKKYQTTQGTMKVLRANMFRNSLSVLNENNEEQELTLEEWQALDPHRPEPHPNNAQPKQAQQPQKAAQGDGLLVVSVTPENVDDPNLFADVLPPDAPLTAGPEVQPQQAQPQAEAAPAENSKSRRRRRRKSQQRQDGAAE